jgi:type IV pilus assembly protein PilW
MVAVLKTMKKNVFPERCLGFTLVELMVAMTVGLIVLAAIYNIFIVQNKSFDVEEQISEMQQNARAAMDIMTREIRMAGYDSNSNAAAKIITASASTLSFSVDVPSDNTTITYAFDSGLKKITRTEGGGGAQPLAENIQAMSFTYYDTNGNVTAVAADIRQIKIDITARTSKADAKYSANGGYRTYQLTSNVKPRNLS